ncbi:MAG: hypothetical protein QOE23_3564 [Pseudonocardiales bacterium]|jgi:hypothetical protein|nr:hypothetical protein [Pseudonocardiales bacterium]
MDSRAAMRTGLTAALSGTGHGREAADRLCGACVNLLNVDGAALSMIYDGAISRSLGSSSSISRELDELQFTLGEGPCLDAVSSAAPVLIADLNDPAMQRWPGFARAATQRGVLAVFALPVAVASLPIGALDLYRTRTGDLADSVLEGGLIAAELAAMPLLDLMGLDLSAAVSDEGSDAWQQLGSLTRLEVYQAAGILIAQLGVSASEALVRLRAYAFSHNRTASEVALDIIEHRLRLPDDATDDPISTEGDGHR